MWPDDRDLPVVVEAAFGADVNADPGTWLWTDLSGRLAGTPITVRVLDAQFSPGTCSVTLLNDDGALTPLHPMSPYWPDVELGTPLRVAVRRVEDGFGRTSSAGWGTADSGQVWSAFGAGGANLITDQTISGGKARQSVPVTAAYRASWLPGLKLRDCRVRLSGLSLPFTDVTGGSVEPGNILLRMQSISQYYLARVEITTAEQVVCKLYDPAGALLASATVPGLTHSASQSLEVVAEVVGSRLRMKVWPTGGAEPSGWAVTATDTSLSLPGGVGVRTGVAAGNTNTLPVVASFDSVTVYVDRFSGFADQWEPTFIPITTGESASAVRVTCSGILRRLGQGTQPDQSPLRRTIAGSGPVAYWPVEDGVTAGQAGAATAGAPPLTVTGSVEFKPVADYTYNTNVTRYGTSALANLAAGGSLSASLPAVATAATATGWTVHVATQADPANLSGDLVMAEWATPGGTFVRWQLVMLKAVNMQVIAYDSSGAATVVLDRGGARTSFDTFGVAARQSGSNIAVALYTSATSEPTGTVPGTLTGITSIAVNPTGTTAIVDMPFGHIAVWASDARPYRMGATVDSYGEIVWDALRSYLGEPAHVRLARLAAEDGVPLAAVPAVDAEAVARMGWQSAAPRLELYEECVEADLGVLYEDGFGLGYIPRTSRYNKPVDMTVDLSGYAVTGRGDVLEPAYDDRGVRNQWTVERRDGSSAVSDDPASQRKGVYSDSVELNLASDAGLMDQAAWRVHLGTVVDLREDTFPLDLAANPGLVDGWLSCGVGSRIVRTNPPAQYPGPLDRLVAGWSETLAPRSWLVQVTPSPAASWDIATIDGEQRVAADGSALAADLTAGGMSLLLASTADNGPWTTDPADFPLPVRVGGERVTASSIASSATDGFGRTASNGWGTADSGQAWTTSGGAAADYSVSGGLGLISQGSVNVMRHATLPAVWTDIDVTVDVSWLIGSAVGASATGWLLAGDDLNNYYAARVELTTAGTVNLALLKRSGGILSFIPGAAASAGAHAGGNSWRLRLRKGGTGLRAEVTNLSSGASAVVVGADVDAGLTGGGSIAGVAGRLEAGNTNSLPVVVRFDGFAVLSPQVVTLSARGVNGVQREWPAGAEVDVWQPAIAAL